MNNFTKHRRPIVSAVLLAVLGACGGGSSSEEFPVNEAFAAALVSKGVPSDIARYFAASKLSYTCPSSTSCTYRYTYPNGATRVVTLTATPNQQYTPTAAELAAAASISSPVYDGTFTATGVEESSQPVNTNIALGYFAPTTSIVAAQSLATAELRFQAAASDGFQINLMEVGAKGVDVSIGSILEYYEATGKAVKTTGSVYAIASALSDIAGAMALSKEINAMLAELAALEKCAANPTNSTTQSDPSYSAQTVARLQATRAEIKQIAAVRFINIMGETGEGITPVTAVLGVALKSAHSWTEQTLKSASEKLMQDARSSVVSCIPTCPTSLMATGVSESQIDLSWSGSITSDVTPTGYEISGGGTTGATTVGTTWSDTGLNRSTTYCYVVTAFNEYGEAENCPQACGTTFGPPVVRSTGPVNNAKNVGVDSVVTGTFSKAVDPATVTGSTFTLTSPSGPVTGTVSYSGTTATFTPASDLAFSTVYSATITTGVKDLDGLAMEENHQWSFTTEAAQPEGNLQFSTIGGIFVGTASVTWTKFEDLGDTRRFVPSGTITVDINYPGCDPLRATVPIRTDPLRETMVVYTASNAAFPKSYIFSLAGDPSTVLTLACGDPRTAVPLPAEIAVMVGQCGPIPFTDEANLMGMDTCPPLLDSATWDF